MFSDQLALPSELIPHVKDRYSIFRVPFMRENFWWVFSDQPALPALPDTSRLLDEKEKQHANRQDVVRRAIRYDGLKGGEADV